MTASDHQRYEVVRSPDGVAVATAETEADAVFAADLLARENGWTLTVRRAT